MTIGSGGSYSLAGGLLQVNGNLLNQGVFSGGAAPAVLSGSGILDLSAGTLQNAGNISVSIAANSLLIVPPGFSPATGFAAYSSLGLTHTLGTTLAVPAGQGFGGSGSINDLVACQGTIAATGVAINLNDGLVLSGTGQVLLGSGIITNNDLVSGISGGGLSAVYQYVGSGGTGSFTQSGGTSAIRDYLYLGYGAGDSGVYALSGGQLSAGDQYIGYSGAGSSTQSGGTNSVGYLYLGNNSGSTGSYSLSGSGSMSAIDEYVGFSGTGSFRQSGGTNGTSYFNLGENYSSGNGTYYLSGGQLSAGNEYLGYSGSGTFTQSGGTNTASGLYLSEYSASEAEYNLNGGLLVLGALAQGFEHGGFQLQRRHASRPAASFSTAVPLVLLGGAEPFDTAGYAVTLSGSLSGPGSLTKVDSGTLTLATANTFTGNTLISGGMLVLGDSLALQYSTLDTSGSGVISFGTYAATFGGLTGSGRSTLPAWLASAWAATTAARPARGCSKAQGA